MWFRLSLGQGLYFCPQIAFFNNNPTQWASQVWINLGGAAWAPTMTVWGAVSAPRRASSRGHTLATPPSPALSRSPSATPSSLTTALLWWHRPCQVGTCCNISILEWDIRTIWWPLQRSSNVIFHVQYNLPLTLFHSYILQLWPWRTLAPCCPP